ncbi:MAG TPA: recombinase-like helix-turn-helix domain-containing protein [Alphaproteobacteria bacterium]|nr:recombinase-like helix-turn-helix domain-containing protein [Alphaproteobacteria bacterium]
MVPDFNPHLRPPAATDGQTDAAPAEPYGSGTGSGANKGDASSIERYDPPQLIRWQTRPAPPNDYENALGDALEALFTREIYALDTIIDGLNESGPADPDGKPWTESSFTAAMKRLGDGEPVGRGT